MVTEFSQPFFKETHSVSRIQRQQVGEDAQELPAGFQYVFYMIFLHFQCDLTKILASLSPVLC